MTRPTILLSALASMTLALSSMSVCPSIAHAKPTAAKAQSNSKGWLGVQMERNNTTGIEGIVVQRPVPGSPAESSGLTAGDVIQSANGTQVANPRELSKLLADQRAGDKIVLDIKGPNARRVELTLTAPPADPTNISASLIGRPAPQTHALNIESGSSENVTPNDGKVRIVELWATWCGPCRVIQPTVSRHVEGMDSAHFEFVGVAEDDAAAVKTYLKRYPANYRIVLDPKSNVGSAYWSTATPTFVLIDHKGNVAAHQSGIGRVDALFQHAKVLVQQKQKQAQNP